MAIKWQQVKQSETYQQQKKRSIYEMHRRYVVSSRILKPTFYIARLFQTLATKRGDDSQR